MEKQVRFEKAIFPQKEDKFFDPIRKKHVRMCAFFPRVNNRDTIIKDLDQGVTETYKSFFGKGVGMRVENLSIHVSPTKKIYILNCNRISF